jgi:tetratricopeptide (TPR) repeat protein
LSGNNAVELAGLACAYAASERIDAAAQILDELKERSRPEYVPPFDIALIYSALGQKDNAFAWIEKAFEEGSDFKDELGAGPALDFLRPDPRFQNLLRRMNFPR